MSQKQSEKDILKTFEIGDLEEKKELESEDYEVIDSKPVIKSPQEMMVETAKRIAEAKIKKATLEGKIKQDYDRTIGRETANKNYFYGSGTEDTGSD